MRLFGTKKSDTAASASTAPVASVVDEGVTAVAGATTTTTTTTTTTDYMAHPSDAGESTTFLGSRRRLDYSHLNHPPAAHNADGELPPLTLNPREQKTYERLKKIHYWMDESVTICGRRVGLDPIVGLLPVIGDGASAVVSLVLVAQAAPDLSRYTVARMLANVWIDAVTGVVPVVGDLFDVGWKANERNVAIFEDHMRQGKERRRDADRTWLCGVVLFFVAFCFVCLMVTIAVTVAIVILIVHLVSQ